MPRTSTPAPHLSLSSCPGSARPARPPARISTPRAARAGRHIRTSRRAGQSASTCAVAGLAAARSTTSRLRARAGAVPERPSVAGAQGGRDARWRQARDRGVEGPTRGAGGARGRACQPPGGPQDACAGGGATAPIRATDSAKGGPEVFIIIYMYTWSCKPWGFGITCGIQLHAAQHWLPRNYSSERYASCGPQKVTT